MKTTFNKETYKWEWNLTRWYEKTIYVLALIYTSLVVIAFIAGIISAINE